MPSFDVVSEADMSEVDNAIHNVMREISVRYDFKGSKSSVESSVAIQGEELRVSGKKRDDLQGAIQFIKDLGLEQPVQFKNFRD